MARDKDLDELAQAIGSVCMEWAYIETIVHDMALHLASYIHTAHDDLTARHPLHIAISHMKMRERIAVVKALAHEVKEPDDYYERLVSCLNDIDNRLTLERNRFVHDSWDIDSDDRVVRFAIGPKVIRPQAGKRALVMGTEKTFANVAEAAAFVTTLEAARNSLVDLENELGGLMAQRETQRSEGR